MPTKSELNARAKFKTTKRKTTDVKKTTSAERKQLQNVRAYYREMAKWSDWANNNLTLKEKATQRKTKEKELLTKYNFKK